MSLEESHPALEDRSSTGRRWPDPEPGPSRPPRAGPPPPYRRRGAFAGTGAGEHRRPVGAGDATHWPKRTGSSRGSGVASGGTASPPSAQLVAGRRVGRGSAGGTPREEVTQRDPGGSPRRDPGGHRAAVAAARAGWTLVRRRSRQRPEGRAELVAGGAVAAAVDDVVVATLLDGGGCGRGWDVYADPAGHSFCLVAHSAPPERGAAAGDRDSSPG